MPKSKSSSATTRTEILDGCQAIQKYRRCNDILNSRITEIGYYDPSKYSKK